MPAHTVFPGCAGFIGSSLCDRLLADGRTVVGIDSFEDYYPRTFKEANLAAARMESRFTLVEANILATQQLLEACVAAGVPKVVYASSSSVYGDAQVLPLVETARCQPRSPYGVTKLAGEHLCWLYQVSHALATAALRLFTVYGPRQRPDMAFHKFIRALLDGREIAIYGDGTQTRDFTYVGDIVG